MAEQHRNRWLGAVAGAAGGAAGLLLLGKVSQWLYALEPEDVRKREERLRPELPFEVLARRVGQGLLQKDLSSEQLKRLSSAMHWGYGIGLAAAYGALAPRHKFRGGLAFGASVWLLGDELMTTVMGLSAPPREFPWQNHVRALASHVCYGAAVGGVTAIIRRAA